MTFGSLFSGIGGIDLGLERAGMACKWQVEIDPWCQRVLRKHWPDVPRYADIRTVTAEQLESVDVIAGGYPCQPFSYAGNRKGANDERHLWPHFARLLRDLRPRYAILENVPGHLSMGFSEVLGDLASLGYDAEWTSLRASDVGASHQRKRVFIVAYLPPGGLAAMRKSSGSYRLFDGSYAPMGNADKGRGQQSGRPVAHQIHAERRVSGSNRSGATLEHADKGTIQDTRRASEARAGIRQPSKVFSDAAQKLSEESEREQNTHGPVAELRCPWFAPAPCAGEWAAIIERRPDLSPALEAKPEVRRVANGVSDWMDRAMDRAMSDKVNRIGALGNAVVPQVAELVGRAILRFEAAP